MRADKIFRIFPLLMIFLIIFAFSGVKVWADDSTKVADSLLKTGNASVFYGQVVKVDKDTVTVKMTENIKGPFKKDEEKTSSDYSYYTEKGGPVIKEGSTYICGYLPDTESCYIWSYISEGGNVKILAGDKDSEKMNSNLSEGKFAEAQKKYEKKVEKAEETQKVINEENKTRKSRRRNPIPAMIIVAIIIYYIFHSSSQSVISNHTPCFPIIHLA